MRAAFKSNRLHPFRAECGWFVQSLPQRPANLAQGKDLLFLFFAQEIHRRRVILRHSQCPGSPIPLAAFQVSTDGRFRVSPEGQSTMQSVLEPLCLTTRSLCTHTW
jgi:hypothetical protein